MIRLMRLIYRVPLLSLDPWGNCTRLGSQNSKVWGRNDYLFRRGRCVLDDSLAIRAKTPPVSALVRLGCVDSSVRLFSMTLLSASDSVSDLADCGVSMVIVTFGRSSSSIPLRNLARSLNCILSSSICSWVRLIKEGGIKVLLRTILPSLTPTNIFGSSFSSPLSAMIVFPNIYYTAVCK